MGPNAQASNALGWASIACWVLVYSPQIIESYQLQSGEGLSVLFVVIWLFGDITNLVGAIIAGLLPTVIIIAAYYTLCDIILLVQIYWYRHHRQLHPHNDAERAPLLPPISPNKDAGLKRDNAYTWAARTLEYAGGLCFVTAFGLAAWWWSSKGKDGNSGEGEPDPRTGIVVDLTSQVLGWLSAISYLGSRIPQILKNRQTKCTGLSLALFMFAILGNVTYVLSICMSSIERNHLIANAPWLAGSALTVLLDFVVLGQFFYYRSEEARPLET